MKDKFSNDHLNFTGNNNSVYGDAEDLFANNSGGNDKLIANWDVLNSI